MPEILETGYLVLRVTVMEKRRLTTVKSPAGMVILFAELAVQLQTLLIHELKVDPDEPQFEHDLEHCVPLRSQRRESCD